MRIKIAFFILLLHLSLHVCSQRIEYPIAQKDSVIDELFNKKIYDPYRWMEHPDDSRLYDWLSDQDKISKKYGRQLKYSYELESQLKNLIIGTKFNAFDYLEYEEKKDNSKYEVFRETREMNQPPNIYYKEKDSEQDFLLAKAKNFRYNKSDNVLFTSWSFDPSESLIALQLSHSGSDWRELFVFDLNTGKQLNDSIKYIIQTPVIWDAEGFYYIRYDEPEKGREHLDRKEGERICYHKIGDKQKDDKVIFKSPRKTSSYNLSINRLNENELIVKHPVKRNNDWNVAFATLRLDSDQARFNQFLVVPENYSFVIEEMMGDTVIIRTNFGAPNSRVLMSNLREKNKIYELVPEYKNSLVRVNRLGNDKLACIYLLDGKYSILVYDLNGKILQSLEFAEGKKVTDFRAGENSKYVYYRVEAFYHPPISFRMKLDDFSIEPLGIKTLPFDYSRFETKYVTYKSKDGTEIPAYITFDKDIDLKSGENPVLVYGYGGYGNTITPSYNREYMLWLLNGGILVIPNVRGGGAKGTAWASQGRRLNKQNTIDDFISCSDYLVNQEITNYKKIAIKGASHGGLLVAASLTQAPDKFGAAIAEAGVYDMIRFENFTVAGAETNLKEYGTVTDSLDFVNLLSYSPYHNVNSSNYPPVLIITGDSDDRVPPLHSYKFAARLQDANPDGTILLKLIEGAGHNMSSTWDDYFELTAYTYHFLFKELDMDFIR